MNDDLAITAVAFLMVASEARAHRDASALARVRRQALAFLLSYHHVDPRQSHLDNLVCVTGGYAGTMCEHMKYLYTGGKTGQDPFAMPAFDR